MPVPLTIRELDTLLRQIEVIPETGDFQVDVTLQTARDRLLVLWAEARRSADHALDGANLPPNPTHDGFR